MNADTLELILQEFPKPYNQRPRKNYYFEKNSFLHGAPGVGKSAFLHKFLWENAKQAKGLYLDFFDWRLNGINFNIVKEFVLQKKITHLAIDNAPDDICTIDGVEIFAASRHKIETKNFAHFYLPPLDFEEFAAFEKYSALARKDDESGLASVFSHFAHIGNMPEKLLWPEARKIELSQKYTLSFCHTQTEKFIFQSLCQRQAHGVSLLQIYDSIKSKTKISKDFLYQKINDWQNKHIINFVPKIDSPKSPKKLYFTDFSLPKSLVLEKDFSKLLENIIFCEISQKELFYADMLAFYIPSEQTGIIARAFDDVKALEARATKIIAKLKNLDVKQLDIITLNTEFNKKIADIEVNAAPFWNFAMQKN